MSRLSHRCQGVPLHHFILFSLFSLFLFIFFPSLYCRKCGVALPYETVARCIGARERIIGNKNRNNKNDKNTKMNRIVNSAKAPYAASITIFACGFKWQASEFGCFGEHGIDLRLKVG